MGESDPQRRAREFFENTPDPDPDRTLNELMDDFQRAAYRSFQQEHPDRAMTIALRLAAAVDAECGCLHGATDLARGFSDGLDGEREALPADCPGLSTLADLWDEGLLQ